jgi:hypothetical protein
MKALHHTGGMRWARNILLTTGAPMAIQLTRRTKG